MKRDKRQGEGGKEGEEMQWMEDHAREDWGARWIKLFDRRLEWTRHCMNCMYSEKIFVARIFYVTGYTCSEFDWFWVGVTGSHHDFPLVGRSWLGTEHSFGAFILKATPHIISRISKIRYKRWEEKLPGNQLTNSLSFNLITFFPKKKYMRWLRFLMKLRGKV